MAKTVRVHDLQDVCDALTEHSKGIYILKKSTKKNNRAFWLSFMAGLIFGIYEELRIQNIERAMEDTYESTKLQDQLDSQEEKILQLELELEELKKKG